MDPLIEAAWIAGSSGLFGAVVGVAGTTIVGIVSSRATRSATLAAIDADQHARVWEKRVATYEDMLSIMRTRADIRYAAWEGLITDDEPNWPAEPEGWSEKQDRVLAFSSDAVRDGFAAAKAADTNFHAAVATWTMTAMHSSSDGERVRLSEMADERQATEEALDAAGKADLDVVQTIRSELQAGPPSQARRGSASSRADTRAGKVPRWHTSTRRRSTPR